MKSHHTPRMAALALLAGLAGGSAAWAEDVTAWRLFVTDQATPGITVLDPAKGETIGHFDVKGYVTHLVSSTSGQTVFAVQMDHDVVNVLGSGIALSDHGEHSDVEVGAPKLLPVRLEGGRPVHVVPHGDEALVFFDKEGEARRVSEAALIAGDGRFDAVKAAAPHHGVAVSMGRFTLVSEPDLKAEVKPGDLPPRLGVKILDEKGQQVGDIAPCTGLHGEASSAGLVAFGCEEGVIVAHAKGDAPPELKILAYGDLPKGRVGTLLGGKAMQFFLGNYGEDKVVVIDPESEKPFRLVDLPVRRVDFALDPARVKTAYIFTEDGKISELDILSGAIIRSTLVTEPYSKDGHWRDARPRLAVMGDTIAVTDPRKQRVVLLDAATFTEKSAIPVAGLPFNIVAVGGSGVRH